MARGSTILGHIVIIHLPPPSSKKGDGPLVHREIYFKTKNSIVTLVGQRTYPVAIIAIAEVDARNFEPK
jgi:hypothetical protein